MCGEFLNWSTFIREAGLTDGQPHPVRTEREQNGAPELEECSLTDSPRRRFPPLSLTLVSFWTVPLVPAAVPPKRRIIEVKPA